MGGRAEHEIVVVGAGAAEVGLVLLKPRSPGAVRLRSSDPEAAPLIELPGVRDPHDVERLTQGFRLGCEIVNDGRVRQACARPATPMPSGPGALEAFVRANAHSIPHVVGTCAMGREPEVGAVVDAAGRVHGMDGLYVADASIMPDAPSGFPLLGTIMIAEAIAARSFRI